MSYDFCRGLGISSLDKDGDAHTAIHETGHMLGLSDYYATTTDGDTSYNAVGTYDMMSANFLDHALSSFQKPSICQLACVVK